MTHGISGGFFLPAQRSVHCKGGFFSSATSTPTVGTTDVSRATAPFPVLFTLPQVPSAENATDSSKAAHPKPRASRIYDPHEGEDDWEVDREGSNKRQQNREIESTVERIPAPTKSRFVRGRQHQQHQKPERVASRATSSRSNNVTREAPVKPHQHTGRDQPLATTSATSKGDINSKFEIAMKELHEMKDEFELKQRRQHSAPVLPVTQKTATPITTNAPLIKTTTSLNQASEPQATITLEDPPSRNMQSPRQRLQVAEMVMRKLYKKNLDTEKELAAVKAENQQLVKRVADLEAENKRDEAPVSPRPSPRCPHCTMTNAVSTVMADPPSLQSISRIDQQQLEYLRHLAAEQDRTIASLKRRIEELSTQLTAAKQSPPNGKSVSASASSQANKTKLQSKLKDALSESDRQKTNYLQLKRDFQHLLALKTKTLSANPTQLDASAKQLMVLMDKQLAHLETEHTRHLSLYNSKLYETEQQSCESYAQQRLLEDEINRVARDVQQRDALDVEIEQCMANVFERLHRVESENVHLKYAIQSTPHAS